MELELQRFVLSAVMAVLLSAALAVSASAGTVSFTKYGNKFTTAVDPYCTSTHCGSASSWLDALSNQVILGVYGTDPSAWTGGSATWTFSLPIKASTVTAAKLTIAWPAIYSKGLHSTSSTGKGTVTVGSTALSTKSVNGNILCNPTNPLDRYAHYCSTTQYTFTVPLSAITTSTKVTAATNAKTMWDISKVTLTLTMPSCTASSQCGTNGYVGTAYCSSSDVYQKYRTWTCNSPGAASSYCSYSDVAKRKQDCTNTCSAGVCV